METVEVKRQKEKQQKTKQTVWRVLIPTILSLLLVPNGNLQMTGIVVVVTFLLSRRLHGMALKMQLIVVRIVLKNVSTNQHVSHSISPSMRMANATGKKNIKKAPALGKIVVRPTEIGSIILYLTETLRVEILVMEEMRKRQQEHQYGYWDRPDNFATQFAKHKVKLA